MDTPTLQLSEEASAAVAKTPDRVTLDSIKAKIAETEFFHPDLAPHMTVAFVRMENGFIVIGKSAPADPANFNRALGEQYAVEDAIRQLWQFEGYLLREELHERALAAAAIHAPEGLS